MALAQVILLLTGESTSETLDDLRAIALTDFERTQAIRFALISAPPNDPSGQIHADILRALVTSNFNLYWGHLSTISPATAALLTTTPELLSLSEDSWIPWQNLSPAALLAVVEAHGWSNSIGDEWRHFAGYFATETFPEADLQRLVRSMATHPTMLEVLGDVVRMSLTYIECAMQGQPTPEMMKFLIHTWVVGCDAKCNGVDSEEAVYRAAGRLLKPSYESAGEWATLSHFIDMEEFIESGDYDITTSPNPAQDRQRILALIVLSGDGYLGAGANASLLRFLAIAHTLPFEMQFTLAARTAGSGAVIGSLKNEELYWALGIWQRPPFVASLRQDVGEHIGLFDDV